MARALPYNYRLIQKKLQWSNIYYSQFYSDLAEILAILSTHWQVILIKFDEDWTKIVNFLLGL